MGEAIAPSSHTVVAEMDAYLSFPAIAQAGGRLAVVFRAGKGNPLDFTARILLVTSDDNGETWSEPAVWAHNENCDSRNCGGNTLSDGRAHFVYDIHSVEGWRRPHVRFSEDGLSWTEPVWLDANKPGGPDAQRTSIVNQGLEWGDGRIYFPCFRGNSVLYDPKTGAQEQYASVPRHEPAIAWNRRGELVAFSKGGPVDVSSDRGRTWVAAGDMDTICQPDLIQLSDGRLLFCYSGKLRLDEWAMLSEDGRNVYGDEPVRIFDGAPGPSLDSRGKTMCIERDGEILTVLYESDEVKQHGKIYLVRTPIDAL